MSWGKLVTEFQFLQVGPEGKTKTKIKPNDEVRKAVLKLEFGLRQARLD